MSDKVAEACRAFSGYSLDFMSKAVISIGGMEMGHGEQMIKKMGRQIAAAKLLLPLIERNIDICDVSTERVRIFRGVGMHVL